MRGGQFKLIIVFCNSLLMGLNRARGLGIVKLCDLRYKYSVLHAHCAKPQIGCVMWHLPSFEFITTHYLHNNFSLILIGYVPVTGVYSSEYFFFEIATSFRRHLTEYNSMRYKRQSFVTVTPISMKENIESQ